LLQGVKRFLQLEEAGGIFLIVSAVLALVVSNSPLHAFYRDFLDLRLEIAVGQLRLGKPLELWISEGLMAVFFLLVGLEIKRELLQGELSSPRQAALPAIAAIGGMLVPAVIYAVINSDDPGRLRGWAIPSATDIAFALGVLSLAGRAVPASLKVLLTAISILDDLGAIVIIALFYTENLNVTMLGVALTCTAVLWILNIKRVTRIAPYILVGIIMWVSVLKSGVHATFAGVITALAIPLRTTGADEPPLLLLEEALHPWVAYAVLPLFAFANAGLPLAGITLDHLLQPVTLGIALGLVVGKAAGIFGAVWLAIALRIAALPAGASWTAIFGLACLCGAGFTMSLFIGTLAFEAVGLQSMQAVRMGVLSGSLVSALLGIAVFRFWVKPRSV
jgi:Na+:H+ antiporter, NhaA family